MKSPSIYMIVLIGVASAICYFFLNISASETTAPVAHRISPELHSGGMRPAAAVPAALQPLREAAAPQPGEGPAASLPQESEAVRDSGKRWAVSNLSSEARFSIRYHQDKIAEYLPYMEGKDRYDDDARYGRAARVVALYSAMVIMAAEGQAIPSDLYVGLSPDEMATLKQDSTSTVYNNGLYYPISRSRFGIYYQIKDLLRSHSDSIPMQDVPFEQVAALAHEAMAFRLD